MKLKKKFSAEVKTFSLKTSGSNIDLHLVPRLLTEVRKMSSPKQWTVKSVNDVTCSSDVIYGDDIFRKMEGIESENLIK